LSASKYQEEEEWCKYHLTYYAPPTTSTHPQPTRWAAGTTAYWTGFFFIASISLILWRQRYEVLPVYALFFSGVPKVVMLPHKHTPEHTEPYNNYTPGGAIDALPLLIYHC